MAFKSYLNNIHSKRFAKASIARKELGFLLSAQGRILLANSQGCEDVPFGSILVILPRGAVSTKTQTYNTMPQLLPHGWYSLLPPVLCTMAWTASLFQEGCDYAILRGDAVVQALADSDNAPYLEVGLEAYRQPVYDTSTAEWKIAYTGACLEYPTTAVVDVTQDAAWQVAKFLDFAATVLGGAGAFFLWFSTCCVFSPGTWRWTGYEVLAAWACQGLSFSWFRNDLCAAADVCEFSWGAKMDVVAASLWFVAACLIFIHYPAALEDEPEWIDGDANGDDDDEYDDNGSYTDERNFEEIDLPPQTTDGGGHVPVPMSSPPRSSGQFTGEASTEEKGGKRMSDAQIV